MSVDTLEFLREHYFGHRMILAANRGPVGFQGEEGKLVPRPGAGGLATALRMVLERTRGMSISSAMSAADVEAMKSAGDLGIGVEHGPEGYRVAFLNFEEGVYHKYYNIISNGNLWMVLHYLYDLTVTPNCDEEFYDAWYKGYETVNRRFADAIMALTSVDQVEKHIVMVQDYHLLLCPRFLRESGAGFFITHFLHTPWPQSDYWKVLPRPLFQSIFESLLAADIVGFHERNYGLNFLQGCERFLPEARVNYINWTVRYRERETWIRFYPISVDVAMTRAWAQDPKVAEEKPALEFPGSKVILRVDRADLSKNVVRGFAAYASLLRDHPELQGRVVFLALLNPTREELPKYKTYLEEIYDIVERVNTRYGTEGWQPIELRVEDRFEQSVAGFQRYDALFVTPLFDGMNLVAKEGPLLNESSGVTVLSENAGAYKQLKPWVIGVSPFDIQGMADALWRALTMAEEERRLRLGGMVKHIQANDISKWIMDQLRDMEFKLRIPP